MDEKRDRVEAEVEALRRDRAHLLDELAMAYGKMQEELEVADEERRVAYEELSERNEQLQSRLGELGGRMAARTLEWPLPRVLRTLSQLLRRTRMLRIEEERFRFAHPLLAEVCAEFLPAAERRTAHLRLGTIMEEHQGDPEELAFHFYRAGALKRALAHLLKAAKRARSAFAYAEAQRFLEQAQEAADSQGDVVSDAVLRQLLLQRAEIEDRLGHPDEALTLCQRVLRDGDRRASAR
jgi:predicted ATPase